MDDTPATTAQGLLQRKEDIERRLVDLLGDGQNDVSTSIIPVEEATATTMPTKRVARKSARKATHIEAKTKQGSVEDNASNPTTITTTTTKIPFVPKTDTHWDFVMKEMMWLGADFQGERKRQVSLARKMALSIKLYHKTKESRRIKELQLAELKRRKVAAKLGREVLKGWWSKIEKVITYKQKLQADQERQLAMNKQLVVLVQQTEKYTESLSIHQHDVITEDDSDGVEDSYSDDDDDDEDTAVETEMDDDATNVTSDSCSESASSNGQRKQQRRRRRQRRRLTIEEALATQSSLARRSKQKLIDYARMQIPTDELFFGGSTASDASGSDGSYDPDNASDREESDNESTLQQAIQEELHERNRKDKDQSNSRAGTFVFLADPEELRKLREEVHMDVQDVIGRLQEEGMKATTIDESDVDTLARKVESMSRPGTPTTDNKSKHVSFSDAVDAKKLPHQSNTVAAAIKYDADDDADASDVEDYNDEEEQRSDEEGEPEVDDENTMEQEEALLQEKSTFEELALLQREGETPVEDLRKKYAKLSEDKKRAKGELQTEAPTMGANDLTAQLLEPDDDQSEEFEPPAQPEVDDETTMEAEERLGRDMTYEEEMEVLQRESEMPIEELRAMYAKAAAAADEDESLDDMDVDSNLSPDVQQPSLASAMLDGSLSTDDTGSDGEGTEEFEYREADAVDDESTLEAEERMGRDMSYQEELAVLKQESEMSVEELRAKYADVAEDGDSHDCSSQEQDNLLGDFSNDENDAAEEFVPDLAEVDDERTLEAEEKMGREMTYADEMALLQRESEISLEELRAMYGHMDATSDGGDSSPDDVSTASIDQRAQPSILSQLAGQIDENDDDEEFQPDEDVGDDETTIKAEEQLSRDMSHEEEIALLKCESEVSIEELREMYARVQEDVSSVDEKMNEADGHKQDRTGFTKRKRDVIESENSSKKTKSENSKPTRDDGLEALQALEASAQRAQQTLASRPFLLAPWVKLRHYQQVGLNWLVSLQSRRLNGVLADEMGLGKTLQTIALLSYLASYKGIWGPHLIIVPTSVIINWETELKRFCPALKVLTYYGSAKRRKELRQGWTKTNWYHVVITSYQLAVQDAFAFKRKKWYYLVLDEAQNIKNFQSQRWQTLIHFNTQRRLLLTGTPLQNNLMELWSLLHFLMPYIFRSRKEFAYWFSNPMNNMIEGNASRNDDVVKRLHGIIRPFVLRRLKKDVETQMPGKFEHVVKCQLSRRQMTLYEEFLSRSSTRVALKKGGNFMGMMNVLMQLRKVCNHPDLFEPRSVITPFVLPAISMTAPLFVCEAKNPSSIMSNLSRQLMEPLWTGSQGLPSIDAALRHDRVEAEELRRLWATVPLAQLRDTDRANQCPDELKSLFDEIQQQRKERARSNNSFQNYLNQKRCYTNAFPYPERLILSLKIAGCVLDRAESVEILDRKVILTPESLLKMRKTEQERANQMEETIDKFVFCVPSAGAREPRLHAGDKSTHGMSRKDLDEMLLEPVKELLQPYRKAQARLSSYFPDKKLIQFDAGKLQTLADLLHTLKRGGHRCLIFTQMSKMLDILEAFLNLNGHTYLRLDGSTGVDRRQRYMDRFNNDIKIFCFILSTRSGGMGVNLTGADTVIFYDSDWNPAMDAQAQDRAHRIGQTREVHIYRLITEHTIEENILLKAKQKKNLDIMVMDQGKFDASHHLTPSDHNEEPPGVDDMKEVFTKGGLQAILGVRDDGLEDSKDGVTGQAKDSTDMSSEQMEKAMTSLEDEDDVQALRGAQKEAAEELREFDENAEISKESDAEDDDAHDEDEDIEKVGHPNKKVMKQKPGKPSEDASEAKNEESELEKEFAAWQTSVGFDATVIEASLSPMERYGLSFRENIDPFYSIFYINELRRKREATEDQEEIDIEAIEHGKAMEERKAMDDGDLLATRPRPERLVRQRDLYYREKARLRSDKKRRKITGDNWIQNVDGLTKGLFWYNEDTGEASWDTPAVVTALRAEDLALKEGWSFLQIHILAKIMEYLVPYPERQTCALVCKQWKVAANDFRFIRHVYPVEMGALGRDPNRREPNHFATIEEALAEALPGDTIELSDGHYWVTDAGLSFDKPIKLIGDEHNPANVVLEMGGSVEWSGKGGFIEGVTLRRPKLTSTERPPFPMLKISGYGRVDIVRSVLDNEGSTGSVVVACGAGLKGEWESVTIRNGGCHGIELFGDGVTIILQKCTVRGSKETGIMCRDKANFTMKKGTIRNHGIFGVELSSGGSGTVTHCQFRENASGPVQRESGCNLTASMNVAIVARTPKRGLPGFKILTKAQHEKDVRSTSEPYHLP